MSDAAEAFIAVLADRLPTLAAETGLRDHLTRTSADVRRSVDVVLDDVIEGVAAQIQIELADWRDHEYEEILRADVAEVNRAIATSLEAFDADLGAARLDLTGDVAAADIGLSPGFSLSDDKLRGDLGMERITAGIGQRLIVGLITVGTQVAAVLGRGLASVDVADLEARRRAAMIPRIARHAAEELRRRARDLAAHIEEVTETALDELMRSTTQTLRRRVDGLEVDARTALAQWRRAMRGSRQSGSSWLPARTISTRSRPHSTTSSRAAWGSSSARSPGRRRRGYALSSRTCSALVRDTERSPEPLCHVGVAVAILRFDTGEWRTSRAGRSRWGSRSGS